MFSLLCKDEQATAMALEQIDRVMQSFYPNFYSNRGEDYSPRFIDPDFPIFETTDTSIVLKGRLPMEKEAFVEEYWGKIRKKHQRANPGILFKIEFLADDTVISVSAETKKENNRRKQNGEPILSVEAQTTAAIEPIQQILKDLKIKIVEIATEFATRLD
ncbi:hypothetical protein IKG29_02940 [Candidatus Saccharibacteria bacterium]|nr:hypothetical protein [Candidatus Saccharibacteria bacterium]